MAPLTDLPENGSFVTWREMILALNPVHLKLRENSDLLISLIKKVDIVLEEGLEHRIRVERRMARKRTIRFWITIGATLLSGSVVTVALLTSGHL